MPKRKMPGDGTSVRTDVDIHWIDGMPREFLAFYYNVKIEPLARRGRCAAIGLVWLTNPMVYSCLIDEYPWLPEMEPPPPIIALPNR